MLFLSRKVGESIVINKNIVVTVAEVRSNTVKLTFDFPSTAEVLRKEVFDRIEQENKLAALTPESITANFEKELPTLTKNLKQK